MDDDSVVPTNLGVWYVFECYGHATFTPQPNELSILSLISTCDLKYQNNSLSKSMVSFDTTVSFKKLLDKIEAKDIFEVLCGAREFASINLKPSEKVWSREYD